jgi:hypothetical protein
MANKTYAHVSAAVGATVISANSGVILGGVYINIPGNAATSSVLTLFDAATAAQATAANTVAVINVGNTNIPGFEYGTPLSRGLAYSYVQTGAVTTVGDFTITYQ